MKAILPLAVLCTLLPGAFCPARELTVRPVPGITDTFIMGADISSLAQIEECGGKYYDADGQEKDMLLILKERGVNWIRLRLWNDPVNDQPVIEGGNLISNKGQRVGGGTNGLDRDIGLAKRAKALGMKVLLDFHYSDFWADPGKQNKPAAWKGLTGKALEKALYDYTRAVIRRMADEDARPDMVQIGNEINNGMLWPDGKIWGASGETVGGFAGFVRILARASRAVRDADRPTKGEAPIKIAIHLADGGDNGLYRTVFDQIRKARIDYDVIGLSYYSYWHGPVSDLEANLRDVAARYGKDVAVMETAYGFTEADGDGFGNAFKPYDDGERGYLASVQGQATAVRDVIAAVAGVPDRRGIGVFYWEPGWIPVPGAGWRTGEGDSWDNQAMFDFAGNALPSLDVFSRVRTGSDVAPPVPVEAAKVRVTATAGETIPLPPRVRVTFSDDSFRYLPAEWDLSPLGNRSQTGTAPVAGTVTGYGLPVAAEVTFTRVKNLVGDPSFERGNLEGWTYSGPEGACFAENNAANAHTGKWTYKYWLATPFRSTLTRTFTGLPNGTYVLKCAAMGGGGENSIALFARDFGNGGEASVGIVNTGWKKWAVYETPAFEVTNGRCTIGIGIDAKAGNWGNFDDLEFYLVP